MAFPVEPSTPFSFTPDQLFFARFFAPRFFPVADCPRDLLERFFRPVGLLASEIALRITANSAASGSLVADSSKARDASFKCPSCAHTFAKARRAAASDGRARQHAANHSSASPRAPFSSAFSPWLNQASGTASRHCNTDKSAPHLHRARLLTSVAPHTGHVYTILTPSLLQEASHTRALRLPGASALDRSDNRLQLYRHRGPRTDPGSLPWGVCERLLQVAD